MRGDEIYQEKHRKIMVISGEKEMLSLGKTWGTLGVLVM